MTSSREGSAWPGSEGLFEYKIVVGSTTMDTQRASVRVVGRNGSAITVRYGSACGDEGCVDRWRDRRFTDRGVLETATGRGEGEVTCEYSPPMAFLPRSPETRGAWSTTTTCRAGDGTTEDGERRNTFRFLGREMVSVGTDQVTAAKLRYTYRIEGARGAVEATEVIWWSEEHALMVRQRREVSPGVIGTIILQSLDPMG